MSTMTTSTSSTIARPQPLGVLPLPAGYLVLPDLDPAHHEVLAGLCRGQIPTSWPPALETLRLALSGDLAAAAASLDGDDSPVGTVNRLVLTGDPNLLSRLAGLDGDLAAHVRLVAFSLGLSDEVPDPSGLDGVVAALAHAAVAAAATAAHEHGHAVLALESAVEAARPESEALTGQLLGALAGAMQDAGAAAGRVLQRYEEGLRLLEASDLRLAQAELHLAAGMVVQELAGENRDALGAAVRHYQGALRLADPRVAPELFAQAHTNLATAYLTMPMLEASDQLRVGIAVRSLRKALEILDPERHSAQVASVRLNLANALVYLPSQVQGDNLVEAVELYEEVLAERDADADPAAYARAAANQGNALAHLGMFDQATARLHEARVIFDQIGDYDGVATVREVLGEIARQVARDGKRAGYIGALPPKPEAGASASRYPTEEIPQP
ncbi:MAG: hypothetical protein ABGZ36_18125 [Actinomycetota bacterium]|uniref:hypothetical protein n=1 Tax=Euzebya rosea TaxID=2052804 RepID=UPI00196AEF84|nr:hypothetical protein [Euzebya rosea]